MGHPSLYKPFTFAMPPSFAGSSVGNPWPLATAGQAHLVLMASRSPYGIDSSVALNSDVVSIASYTTANAMLSLVGEDPTSRMRSAVGGQGIMVAMRLVQDTNAPICVWWNTAADAWNALPGAIKSKNRAAGSSVFCEVDRMGSFSIQEGCSPATSCTGRGSCNRDGSCKCELGRTGASCEKAYCDLTLFKCTQGGEGRGGGLQ